MDRNIWSSVSFITSTTNPSATPWLHTFKTYLEAPEGTTQPLNNEVNFRIFVKIILAKVTHSK